MESTLASTAYDQYNREERAICAHLFRLLHENLNEPQSPFMDFLKLIEEAKLEYVNGEPSYKSLTGKNKAIYCEVALIRDKYHKLKKQGKEAVYAFMDDLVQLVAKQENVSKCTLYSDLKGGLNDPKKTHPKQIRYKAKSKEIPLSDDEVTVYGAIQGMFNAKPDLVLTIDDLLLVCEAKFTEKFDKEQLRRTWSITQVWGEKLYKDLGFMKPPNYTVFKLGAKKFNPDINWEQIHKISESVFYNKDKSRMAFKYGVKLLTSNN